MKSCMSREVSVIVPTFKRAQELDSLLLPSLAEQTLLPFEIIVVDDTPDNSVETVCAKWGRLRSPSIKLFYRRNAYGRSSAQARNYGISMAKSNFLMFLDSDLILDPGYIKAILDVFLQDPDAAGVQGYISNISDHPQIKRAIRQKLKLNNLYPVLSIFLRNLAGVHMPSNNSCRIFEYPVSLDKAISCEWLSGSNVTIQNRFFNRVKFDTDLKGYSLGEDVIFSKALRRFGKIYITPFARCKHMDAKSGNPTGTEIKSQEKMFFQKMFGIKGLVLYFNKMTLMKLAEAMGV